MNFTKHSKILCIVALTLLICFTLQPFERVLAANLEVGSKGDLVTTLQKKLKRWGYYNGPIDGKYGEKTRDAVIYFQKYNNLNATGVVNDATAKKIGISLTAKTSTGGSSKTTSKASSSDVYLLARCIHAEGRGESYKGKVAIGAVILNRVKSSKFPNSVSGVIYQAGAFDAVSDGQINLAPDETSLKAARDAMNGWDPTNGCIYYYNPNTATNKWIRSRPISITIGDHVFCY